MENQAVIVLVQLRGDLLLADALAEKGAIVFATTPLVTRARGSDLS